MGTNVLESSKKKLKSERAGEKKMSAAGMFLNEGEKENKRGGGEIEIGVWRRKTRKKEMKLMDEMK